MFHFPMPPDTLVTRQIECVSCKEIFTVAEDYAAATDGRSKHWRMPSENPVHTELNDNPEIMRQRVYPLPRQTLNQDTGPIPTWESSQRTHVTCPRCGADNRNWVRLAYAPPSAFFFQTLTQWLQRYWLVLVGLVVSLTIAGILVYREKTGGHLAVYGPMISAVLLVGLIPIFTIPAQWRREREHKIVSKYNKSLPFYKRIAPGWMTGSLILFVFLFVLPGFLYLLLPSIIGAVKSEETLTARIDRTLTILDPDNIEEVQNNDPNRLIPLQNALTSLQQTQRGVQFLCSPVAVSTFIGKLDGVAQLNTDAHAAELIDEARTYLRMLQTDANGTGCNQNLIFQTMLSLGELSQYVFNTCSANPADASICDNDALVSLIHDLQMAGDPGSLMFAGTLSEEIETTLKHARAMARETTDPALLSLITQEVDVIETIIKTANGQVNNAPGKAAILNTWAKVVGLSGIVAMVTAVAAVNIYIDRINQHLPRPVCHSVSRLTRIVLREAKHSLKINGHFEQIEWEEASRNPEGGIVLSGYLCPPLNGDPADQPKYIRAMRYHLYSELWGRIVIAEGRSVRISPSVHQAWERQTTDVQELNRLFVNQEQS
jgi:hypothetical protein